MQKLIVALTLLFGGIAANDRDGHSRLLRGRGKTVDYPEAGSKTALSRQDAGDEPVRAAARRLATVEEGIPPECVLAFEAVTKDGLKLKDFPACIDNLVVVTEAVLNKPESFADAGPVARDTILIQMIAKNRKSDTVIPFDDEETVTFKSSDVFALPAVAKNGMDLKKYPESKDNVIVVMQAVLRTPNAFQFAGCHAQSDLLIQLVATGLSPANLDFVQKGCGEPTPVPTAKPTAVPTAEPTAKPTTAEPTPNPTAQPTPKPTLNKIVLTEDNKIVSDAQAGSRWFGSSVAMVGDLLAVGADGDKWPGSNVYGSGAAYLYRFDYGTSSWIEEKKVIPSKISPNNFDFFGSSIALSENGNVLAVGSPRFYGAGYSCCVGAAFIYRYDETTKDWLEEARVEASVRKQSYFGQSVALSDDFLLVGAYAEDTGAYSAGAAYVYKHEGGSWVEKARLLAAGPPVKSRSFGAYVALSGTVAAVGATGDDDFRGAVYVYDLSGDPSSWSGTEKKITLPDGEADDYFGRSVKLSGDLLACGSNGGGAYDKSGSAYVFRYDGSSWVQQAKFVASDAAPEDNYGISVAISDSVLAVGANYDNPTGDGGVLNGGHGSAYYYNLLGSDPSKWSQTETKIAPPDQVEPVGTKNFGWSVALSENMLAVGAKQEKGPADADHGSVYVGLL